ncbi:MAG: hypothetical protein ACR2H9_14705 [Longimicrobiaceae bacterium]
MKNILVGAAAVADDPVLRPAVELARRLGETLHVVHACDLAQPILAACARRAGRDGELGAAP